MRRTAIAFAVLLLLVPGCTKSSTRVNRPLPPTTSAPPVVAPPTAISSPFNNHGPQIVSGLKTFVVQADNDNSSFYFSPSVLVGTPGQKLTIRVINEGTVHHNFTLAGQHINKDLEKHGNTATIHVVFPKKGSIEFHCEYHAASGMKGALAAD